LELGGLRQTHGIGGSAEGADLKKNNKNVTIFFIDIFLML
jgi:hypothetical protein